MMDVTRERLAEMVGVSTATVSRWEDDLRRPKPDAMLKLADVLGVSPAWLDYGVSVQGSGTSHQAGQGVAPSGAPAVKRGATPDLEGGAATPAPRPSKRSAAAPERKRRPA